MRFLIVSFICCAIGVGMLILSFLPEEKIDAICALLGFPTKPRWNYLIGGAVVLLIGVFGLYHSL